jgi:hypothetical protein
MKTKLKCERCLKPFEPKGRYDLFCSEACSDTYHKPSDYSTVFGEFYVRENDAVLAATRLAGVNPRNNYAVRYDCVEGLYRVVVMANNRKETR